MSFSSIYTFKRSFCIVIAGLLYLPSIVYSQGVDDISGYEVKKSTPEENYIEMAINYINDGNYDLARRYLQLASMSGDEDKYEEAVIWGLYIDALEGDRNIEGKLNMLMDEANAKAHYLIADGWQNFFEKNPEAIEIYKLSQEFKEKLIAKYPDSEWAFLSLMQLVPSFINEKNYDKALIYLIKYFEKNRDNIEKIDDKAWFYMGQILENSMEYRNLSKAIKAYRKVLENKKSIYYAQAKQRINEIEKFYRILP